MNILEAMDDPALFGAHFGGPSWQPWRVFLAALFGLPMDDAALAIYREHTGRQEPPTGPFEEADLIVGRRGGKSRAMALLGTYLAAVPDYEPFLAAGEVAIVAVIAADRKQAQGILRYAKGFIRESEMLSGMVEDEDKESITLNNKVVLEIRTASLRTTRGATYAAILCDESAFWRSEDTSANPDHEILEALRPGMDTIPTAMLLNASSPYRRRGVLWDGYVEHYGKEDAPVLVWKAPTLAMHPGNARLARRVEAKFVADPEAASSEYGAEFRSDLSDFVTRAAVMACVWPGRIELPRGNVAHVGFVDLAGGGPDSFVLGIAHAGSEGPILDLLRELKGPYSPEAAVTEFAGVLKAYGLATVTGDQYAKEWPVERFRAHGITYQASERTKGDIYINALPLLNSGKLGLLDNPRLISQLCGLERRTARGGRDSIDHPPGGHDDVANAALGALLLANEAVKNWAKVESLRL